MSDPRPKPPVLPPIRYVSAPIVSIAKRDIPSGSSGPDVQVPEDKENSSVLFKCFQSFPFPPVASTRPSGRRVHP